MVRNSRPTYLSQLTLAGMDADCDYSEGGGLVRIRNTTEVLSKRPHHLIPRTSATSRQLDHAAFRYHIC